jgi:hypothetical protein
MDNVAFRYSNKVRQMCEDAGVKSDFVAPYTPRTNPIEELFGEIKTYVKLQCKKHLNFIRRDFEGYVKSCVKTVGSRQSSAESHFEMQDFMLSILVKLRNKLVFDNAI